MHGGRPVALASDRIALGTLLACAGAIHLAMAPVHAPTSGRQAAAYATPGALQLAPGGGAVPYRRRWPVVAGAALGAAAVGAWAWCRRWALPLGLGGPEEVESVDALCAALEAAAIAVAVVVLGAARPTILAARTALPLAAVAAVATVAVLAAPSTPTHRRHEQAAGVTDEHHSPLA